MGEGERPRQIPSRYPLDRLVEVMDRLLAPGGCPWDREQDHKSLRPYVMEEAYEVVGAIDSGDVAELRDELGDLLLQVVFHAALASREGDFDINDIVAAITAKLIRRHPHVFGKARAMTTGAVIGQWEDIKAQEITSPGSGGPRPDTHLPALMQAQKLLEKTARAGRTLEIPEEPLGDSGPAAGVSPEVSLGRTFLALTEKARRQGVDAELALRQACADLLASLDPDRPLRRGK